MNLNIFEIIKKPEWSLRDRRSRSRQSDSTTVHNGYIRLLRPACSETRKDNTRIYFMGIITLILFVSSSLSAQEDLINFYPVADTLCTYPEITQPIDTICQLPMPQYTRKKVGKRFVIDSSKIYVSFLGYTGSKKVFIAALTMKPIENPNFDIMRIVDFDGTAPKLGRITTWGYVFDRNNDGKIDYMALVDGAAAFKDDRVPPDFPVRGQNLTMPQLEMFMSHCKIIFNHWADDNFDGKIDCAVHTDMDSVRDWVDRRLVIRSTKFDGTFDEVWAFHKYITDDHEAVAYSKTAVPYRPLGKLSGQITKATMDEKTTILELLNKAALKCNLGKDINKF
jgi:hypothetical protein